MRAQRKRALIFRIEILFDKRRPKQTRCAHLSDFHKEVHSDRPKERKTGRKAVDWHACCNAGAVPGQFIPQWRKKGEEIFETTGLDIFKKVNDEWVAFAKDLIGAR